MKDCFRLLKEEINFLGGPSKKTSSRYASKVTSESEDCSLLKKDELPKKKVGAPEDHPNEHQLLRK